MKYDLSRRAFLSGAGATSAALVVGLDARGVAAVASNEMFVANPFVKILPDDSVVVVAKHFEMGQGTSTGLATLVAEELDADWAKVRVEWAPANAKIYGNIAWGGAQGTGGSTAMANAFVQYREAGALARDLMVRAAAKSWSVPVDSVRIEVGLVSEPTGRTANFGELIEAAARLAPKQKAQLKSPSSFKLIGKAQLARLDSYSKTNGRAKFAIDVRLPDMVVAVVARSPKFGGTATSFDAAGALKIKGVRDVKAIPRGIVVYADNTWAAIKGREALKIEWDYTNAETRSTDQIVADHRRQLDEEGHIAIDRGDTERALKRAAKTVSAEFVFPYLAHAPMEPMNCTVRYDENGAEVWDGCQVPSLVQPTVAGILGMKPEQVNIKTVYAGGSFGRRANPTSDYAAEAAMAAKAIGGKWPVQLVWTREDDLKGGYYRPLYVERVEAGIDADGKPIAWRHRLAGKSIIIGTFFEKSLVKNGVDATSVEGASTLPYSIENLKVDIRNTVSQVPVLWWRSVGHTHTAYSTEIVVDMLAEAAGVDPVDYRLGLLKDHPRHSGVLRRVAEKSGWREVQAKNRGRGVAVHESFNSFVAQVVDVSTNSGGEIKVERVVCAVDCGVAVNPDVIRAQIEGGIGYGLGAVMRNQITLKDGSVEQFNFPDYEPLRINDMPEIEVHIIESTAPPSGVGEPATPPIGPALANAIYAVTGRRIFELPMSENDISFAA
ncbi:MAG: molybdopterin cofactor-binding domain-containing protein [Hyphomicrobiaceae bacterium]